MKSSYSFIFKSVSLFLVLLEACLTEEEKQWPWNPDKEKLDIGEHATLTEVLGRHDFNIQILVDIENKYMAIKDHHFQGCYLIDMRTVHMPVDEIIKGIKEHGVAVLPGEFDVRYPNIPHEAVEKDFGPRIGTLCRYNPTTWLVKHVPITHSEL